MIEIGAKAVIVNNIGNIHSFPKGTDVTFLGMDGYGWYRFEGIAREVPIVQSIMEENFKWIETI